MRTYILGQVSFVIFTSISVANGIMFKENAIWFYEALDTGLLYPELYGKKGYIPDNDGNNN